jgi:nitronate monooxygenase
MWRDRRLLGRLGITVPIIQAPMAGATGADMAVAVGEAGGLGSLPCAMLDPAAVRNAVGIIRQRTSAPLNLNFFTHRQAVADREREAAWRTRLARYYEEFALDPAAEAPSVNRAPFDEIMCEIVEEFRPEVVSFHFGLPAEGLLARVKDAGCVVISSATSVSEAIWLEQHGCDAVIAQGYEAGGHRGMFLTDSLASQVGTMALVPQVVDAVAVPVIAAGGIGDGRGIAAACALGAAAVQIGTAYLFTPEALITDLHRSALAEARHRETALTNVFSGRPARGLVNRVMCEVGPMSDLAPAFPTAGGALAPLKAMAEAAGSSDFSSRWSGQAAGLGRAEGAGGLTTRLAEEARRVMQSLAAHGER